MEEIAQASKSLGIFIITELLRRHRLLTEYECVAKQIFKCLFLLRVLFFGSKRILIYLDALNQLVLIDLIEATNREALAQFFIRVIVAGKLIIHITNYRIT